jgi:hypothetical protein
VLDIGGCSSGLPEGSTTRLLLWLLPSTGERGGERWKKGGWQVGPGRRGEGKRLSHWAWLGMAQVGWVGWQVGKREEEKKDGPFSIERKLKGRKRKMG